MSRNTCVSPGKRISFDPCSFWNLISALKKPLRITQTDAEITLENTLGVNRQRPKMREDEEGNEETERREKEEWSWIAQEN